MKLCQIGCGAHATAVHGPSQARLARERPALVLAGCCDQDLSRAQAFAANFGYARPYDDLDRMLDAERPDAAVLVVPVSVTVSLAEKLLARGLPLLLEKPPGEAVEDVDRLIAAAGQEGRATLHQVAFNRRYVPLMQALRQRLERARPLQHVRYELARVDRRDPDFSTTAIHGIDAVRFLVGSDYREASFRYREAGDLGKGVADLFVDATLASGAVAQLAFCPNAGAVVERATVHALGHSFVLQVPMWGGVDSPGRLDHFEGGRLVEQLHGDREGDGTALFELGGFYRETAAFLGGLAAGSPLAPDLPSVRQSVAVAQALRERRSRFP